VTVHTMTATGEVAVCANGEPVWRGLCEFDIRVWAAKP
jgi:hypothetical protein